MLQINGTDDHIHLLIDVAPKISLSKLVNILKTITSREIRKEFAEQLKPFYWKPIFWKPPLTTTFWGIHMPF